MSISDFKKALAKPNEVIIKNQWRNYYLALIAISTNLITIYALVNPAVGNNDLADFKFPQHIKLKSGKLTATTGLIALSPSNLEDSQTTDLEQEKIKANQQYKYIKDREKISLQMSYLVNTRGDVTSYLQQYTNISPKAIENKKTAQIETIGYHALFHDRDHAYLTSCVSPRSPSNVTQKQFSHHRYQNDLKPQVGWEWLQGKASIRDRRCLWVNLSTPLVLDSHTAYTSLETAWREIYPWLSQNFPSL